MQKLFESAWQDLEAEEWDAALKKAESMRKNSYSGGIEIEARALLGLQQESKALEVLRAAPRGIWSIQVLLAETLCDLGYLEDSLIEYEAAKQCRGADVVWLNYMAAVVLQKLARPTEALQRCPDPRAGELRAGCLALRATLLNELGRHKEAGALAQQGLVEERQSPVRIWLQQAWAVAEHKAGHRANALSAALEALRVHPHLHLAAQVVRELEDCDGTRYWFTVKGRWHEVLEGDYVALDFFRIHHVAALGPQEAFRLVSECEPEPVRALLEIESVEELGPFPSKYGILGSLGRIFCPAD